MPPEIVTEFNTLVEIVAKLRGPNGCPWDKQQTQSSLTPYIIEEAYELVEAIEQGSQQDIKEELGDFLFQVVLQAQVADDSNSPEDHFSLQDVIKGLNEKLIRRHPHVFADNSDTPDIEAVWKNWQKIKNAEKPKSSQPKLFNFPKQLPALQTSAKIGRKTQTYKFDWDSPAQVIDKVHEELRESEEAIRSNNVDEMTHEIGDLLFSTAQLARHLGLDPEFCLRQANQRFIDRFTKAVELSQTDIEAFADLSNQQKESLWSQAKSYFKSLKAGYFQKN